jgi:SAM-dependent methyltransferase
VLPPRTFNRPGDRPLPLGPAAPGGRASWRTHLPTTLGFDDASFDAIIAWDLVDFYDPESARRVAAEVRRILKPGGLLFSFYHASRAGAPDRPRRYLIHDESRIVRESTASAPLPRQVYQNRDIEKMFTGLRIVEQYYLQNGLREILMEKRSAPAAPTRASRPPARPQPRFRIE